MVNLTFDIFVACSPHHFKMMLPAVSSAVTQAPPGEFELPIPERFPCFPGGRDVLTTQHEGDRPH